MEFSASEIASLLSGKVEGDGDVKVNNLSKIDKGEPGTLSFLANDAYEKYIYETEASVVLVNQDFKPSAEVKCTLIRVENAYSAIATLLNYYEQSKPAKTGVEQPSFINSSATIGEHVYVGAFAYVGDNVKLGDNVKIYPHVYIGDNVEIKDNTVLFSGVKVYSDCKIGESCIIHSGVVIGADGFGFVPGENGEYTKIAQVGNVILKDNVEVGANTTIDCATMGSTVINAGAKLDNLIMIGHNVEIGENTVMAGHVGVAGSTKVGRNCVLGGQVGVAGHITIGDGVKIGAQAGIMSNVASEKSIFGSPAFDVRDYLRSSAVFRRLPELKRDLDELKRRAKKEDDKQK
jgi:UDP-3-O-[3-hydroxymyristoyl] glucosamine N-acyltransferase